MAFPPAELALLADMEEVEIETRSSTGSSHRVIIWVVVDDGEVFVRSVRGDRGRWYREAVADPRVALHVAGRRLDARATAAVDAASVERVSRALAAKYAADPALKLMLKSEVLDTNLRLVPD